MRNWVKAAVLLLSIGLWAALLMYGFSADSHHILAVKTVDSQQWENLQAKRMPSETRAAVCFEGEELMYVDALNGYLISQSLNTEHWQGSISVPWPYSLRILRPEGGKKQLIADGEPLKLMIYDETHYEIVHVTASGLPVLSLKKEPEVGHFSGVGELLVIENNALGRENVIEATTYSCHYRNRGQISALSPKRPWKLNLRSSDNREEKRNEPLLGMKNDNDWIANPLFSDSSCMRERIAYDLWELMGGKNEHQSQYCEFLLEGDYQGIYLLSECVDYRTYSMKPKDGFLYSVKAWEHTPDLTDLYAQDAVGILYAQGEIAEFSVDAFEHERVDEAIELLRELKSVVKGEEYDSPYTVYFDEQGLICHGLLIDMLQARDNRYKNQKFALVYEGNNRYRVEKTPWDLDITMMNETYPNYFEDINNHTSDIFVPKDLDEQEIKEKTARLYAQCRETFFCESAMNALIDGYCMLLESSGAAGREIGRWNKPELKMSADYLKDFFDERITALDEYYGYEEEAQ